MSTNAPAGTTILRVLRLCLHTGFAVLLAIATARVLLADSGAHRYVVLAGALGLAALYLAGALAHRYRRRRVMTLGWLAAVTALWAALLVASPDFSWVAFPLFFLHLHLLRRWHGITAVAVITVAVIVGYSAHAGATSVGMTLGPILGAVFAVVIAWGYTGIHAESEQRRELIDSLTRTRAELAASQHQAGIAAERDRLAREIHDTIAQGLSSIVLLLRSAEAALPEHPERSGERIVEARRSAENNLAEARRFVHDLTPPSLSSGSLRDALQRLCERTARESGVHCTLRLDGTPVALPSGYEVALLRAAQSSLANVVQHAQATTAVVTLGYLDTEITLDIYDDGHGFTPDDAAPPRADGSGFGLSSLRDRIGELGGTLAVETAPAEGTAVAIRLPYGGRA